MHLPASLNELTQMLRPFAWEGELACKGQLIL